eukprot:TRINITY_DN992_c0_g1_i1.p1 TRINITY_DN992_c0_g1~~TRINITY_DN992_c0_g1_i1.p1  ORF type:complete len:650 (-),score=59.37 TRINITY_DN992_c0_g1_i1:3422-5371(-)
MMTATRKYFYKQLHTRIQAFFLSLANMRPHLVFVYKHIRLFVVFFCILNSIVCRTSLKNGLDLNDLDDNNSMDIANFFLEPFQESSFEEEDLDEIQILFEPEEILLEDWEVAYEDRIPFEEKYPTLSRTYKYPTVNYRKLENIIQSALRSPKNSQLSTSDILSSETEAETENFVRVQDHQFVLGNKPFYFVGFNSYYAFMHSVKQQDRSKVEILLQNAKQQNLNVMRVFAFCDGPGLEPPGTWSGFYVPCKYTFQESPGNLNEEVFEGLDYLIYKSRQVGIRLILTLTNYKQFFGGVEMYARWALRSNNVENATVLDFFTKDQYKLMYKAYVTQIISRANTFNNVPYADDSTIMAWDLINDPRCANCPGPSFDHVLNEWLTEMSDFVKTLAPKQLVTATLIGYFGETTPKNIIHNPGSWVVCLGTDFYNQFSIPNLDYSSMLLYPYHKRYDYPNEVDCSDKCRREWMERSLVQHIKVARQKLNIPLVIKEFGLAGERNERSLVYQTVFNQSIRSVNDNDALGGVMFWSAGIEGDMDWDNKMVYIDSSRTYMPRPKIEPLPEDVEYKQWLDSARLKYFRREEQWECQRIEEERNLDLFATPSGYKNSTLLQTIESMGTRTCQLDQQCSVGKQKEVVGIGQWVKGIFQSFL